MFRKAIVVLCTIALFSCEPVTAVADSEDGGYSPPETSAAACCLYEARSGFVIFSRDGDTPRAAGHMAKLMTVLLCTEACRAGEISMSDTVTVSSNANSKQGAQIWLDAGEEISVEELMKSVIIGNANDACCALGEYLSGSEESHMAKMNERAAALGMEGTHFADILGESAETVSTAKDIALLAGELSRHSELDEMFTTRIDTVRGGRAELVSTNRLILSYKGIRGTKSCGGEKSGECIAATADSNGMTLCAVLLGEPDADTKLREARQLLDSGAESFRLFEPDINKEYLRPLTVTGGCADRVKVMAVPAAPALIAAGRAGETETKAEIAPVLEAPVKRGQTVGALTCTLDGEKISVVKIVAAENVGKMNVSFALKRTLFNLLDIAV